LTAENGNGRVNIWKPGEIPFTKNVGADGGPPLLGKAVDVDGYGGGYMDFGGGVLDNWTQPSDEIVFVISGTMTLTHGDDVYECGPGDIAYMQKGALLRFEGTEDCRIAYASGFDTNGAEKPVMVWKAEEISFSRGLGPEGGAPFLGKVIGINGLDGGFLHLGGGVLHWTEPGDEWVWVVSGEMTLKHGDDVYVNPPGTFLFLRKGETVSFHGDEHTRIAYASTAV
jgi:ethanolamine utilization protein EutQ (cupin superfamily)